jgi:hypothetical protein
LFKDGEVVDTESIDYMYVTSNRWVANVEGDFGNEYIVPYTNGTCQISVESFSEDLSNIAPINVTVTNSPNVLTYVLYDETNVEYNSNTINVGEQLVLVVEKRIVDNAGTVLMREPLHNLTGITWDTSDIAVAYVNDGIVNALSPGTAIISAIGDGIDLEFTVNVTGNATGGGGNDPGPGGNIDDIIQAEGYNGVIEPNTVSLTSLGQGQSLDYKVYHDGNDLGTQATEYGMWKSSNPLVASVDNVGNIVAHSDGTCEISCYNHIYDYNNNGVAVVNVENTNTRIETFIVEAVSLTRDSYTVDILQPLKLMVIKAVINEDTNDMVYWEPVEDCMFVSQDTNKACITSDGNFTGLSQGTADIVAIVGDEELTYGVNISSNVWNNIDINTNNIIVHALDSTYTPIANNTQFELYDVNLRVVLDETTFLNVIGAGGNPQIDIVKVNDSTQLSARTIDNKRVVDVPFNVDTNSATYRIEVKTDGNVLASKEITIADLGLTDSTDNHVSDLFIEFNDRNVNYTTLKVNDFCMYRNVYTIKDGIKLNLSQDKLKFNTEDNSDGALSANGLYNGFVQAISVGVAVLQYYLKTSSGDEYGYQNIVFRVTE